MLLERNWPAHVTKHPLNISMVEGHIVPVSGVPEPSETTSPFSVLVWPYVKRRGLLLFAL